MVWHWIFNSRRGWQLPTANWHRITETSIETETETETATETGIAGNSRKLNYAWKIIIYTWEVFKRRHRRLLIGVGFINYCSSFSVKAMGNFRTLTCKKALIKLARRTAILASFSNCSLAPKLTSPRSIRSCGWKLKEFKAIYNTYKYYIYDFVHSLLACAVVDPVNILERLVDIQMLCVQGLCACRIIAILRVQI